MLAHFPRLEQCQGLFIHQLISGHIIYLLLLAFSGSTQGILFIAAQHTIFLLFPPCCNNIFWHLLDFLFAKISPYFFVFDLLLGRASILTLDDPVLLTAAKFILKHMIKDAFTIYSTMLCTKVRISFDPKKSLKILYN